MNLQIRQATEDDVATLARIGWQSFDEAFADNPKNHPDDMRIYMTEAFAPETIARDLRDENTIYLIAEIGGESVGYAKLKTNSREDCVAGERPIELCRLYALDRFIGKGVGRALMQKCFELANEKNADVFWLGVWEHNFRAQKFYEKLGFEKCGEHVFQLGSDPQIDWILQRKLNI